jgi:hypothetical protein
VSDTVEFGGRRLARGWIRLASGAVLLALLGMLVAHSVGRPTRSSSRAEIVSASMGRAANCRTPAPGSAARWPSAVVLTYCVAPRSLWDGGWLAFDAAGGADFRPR